MQFLYNENREVVAEKDYSGNIIRYIRGLGLISSDSENAKTYYHYVCDEQGSVSRIIRGEDKENGAAAQDKVSDRVLNHYEYDAFGNTISCEERVANRFRYQSGSTSINPNEIRYSQSSANGSSDIIQSMKANGWQGDPIDVVEMPDGIYTTIDNTRVVSAREAGINVEANVHGYNDPLPSEYIERFTTKKGVPKTWGEAIELRVSKQKASFRNGNPYGKLEMETIK